MRKSGIDIDRSQATENKLSVFHPSVSWEKRCIGLKLPVSLTLGKIIWTWIFFSLENYVLNGIWYCLTTVVLLRFPVPLRASFGILYSIHILTSFSIFYTYVCVYPYPLLSNMPSHILFDKLISLSRFYVSCFSNPF